MGLSCSSQVLQHPLSTHQMWTVFLQSLCWPKTLLQIIKMLPDMWDHFIKNHCFKPWNDLICLFPSCSIKSSPPLCSVMLGAGWPWGLSWWLLPSTWLMWLSWKLIQLQKQVISGPLSHLLPPSRSKWHGVHWLGRELDRVRSRDFCCAPHWDDAIYWLLNFLPQI